MYNGEEKEHVRCLSMEPKILVKWKKSDFWTEKANQISTYSKHDKETVHGKNETGTSRGPYTEFEGIQ